MNTTQKRKILERIATIECDVNALKNARLEIAVSGYASATLASSGGSKSYTRLDLDKITTLINELQQEMRQLRKLLKNESDIMPQSIAIRYS